MIIAEIKGKQYSLEAGKAVEVDHIAEPVGSAVSDIKVLYYNDGAGEILIGKPYLENIKVEAAIAAVTRGKKLRSVRYRPRGGIRKVHGHRQDYTLVNVTKIDKLPSAVAAAVVQA